MMIDEALIDEVKREEGFRAIPYEDTEGVLTIGYGTNIQNGISKEEAELLLRHRLKGVVNEINVLHNYLNVNTECWSILYSMGYQLGIYRLSKFKKMFKALKEQDYYEAANEMKDSLWFRQTPNRALRLVERMRKLGEE